MPFKMAGVVGSLLSPWQQLRDRVRWAMKNQPEGGRSGWDTLALSPLQPGSNCKPSTTRRWRRPLWTCTDFRFTTHMEGACFYRVGLLGRSQPMFYYIKYSLTNQNIEELETALEWWRPCHFCTFSSFPLKGSDYKSFSCSCICAHTHIRLPVFICIDTYVCACAHVCTCVCLWRPEVIFTCPSSDVIHFTA